jgi:hypothetical protein
MINYAEFIKEDSGIFLAEDSLTRATQSPNLDFQAISRTKSLESEPGLQAKPHPQKQHREVTRRIKRKMCARVISKIHERLDLIIMQRTRCFDEKQKFAKIYPLTFKSLSVDQPNAQFYRSGVADCQTKLHPGSVRMSCIESLRTTTGEIDAQAEKIRQGYVISLKTLKEIVRRFLEDPGHYLDVYERHFFHELPFIVYCEVVDVFNKNLGLIKAKRRGALFANEVDRSAFQREKIKWVS